MLPEARSNAILQKVNRELLDRFSPSSPVKLVAVPGSTIQTTLAEWFAEAIKLPAYPLAASDALGNAILDARSDDALLIAITDRPLTQVSNNVIQFVPEPIRQNVSVDRLSAADGEHSEIMVSIVNRSDATKANLRITTADKTLDREIKLPAPGKSEDYFFPVSPLGPTVGATLTDPDDFPIDNTAFVAREKAFPRFQLAPGLAPEVQRIVAAYQKVHPARPGSASILISPDLSDVADIIVANPTDPLPATSVTISPHPISANLDLSNLTNLQAAAPPPPGFKSLITVGTRPLLAVRERPKPQVWIGFSASNFPATTQFVVLWTNILDFLVGSSGQFTAHPPDALTEDWKPILSTDPHGLAPGIWPGIYERADGALHAVSAPPVIFTNAAHQPTAQLPNRPSAQSDGTHPIIPLLLIALGLILIAAVAFPTRRLTRANMPHTVT
jgi:hypothetical protein